MSTVPAPASAPCPPTARQRAPRAAPQRASLRETRDRVRPVRSRRWSRCSPRSASSTSWSRNRWSFFRHVSIWDFLTDTQWTPLFDDAHFGIMVLLSGTLTSSAVALRDRDPAGHHHRDLPVRVRAVQACARSPSRSSSCSAACRPSSTATSRCCSSRRCCSGSTPSCRASTCSRPGIVMGIMIIPYVSSISRGRDARGADEPARRLLRDGRDALPDRDPGGGAGGVLGHRRRPTSSASRARSARP